MNNKITHKVIVSYSLLVVSYNYGALVVGAPKEVQRSWTPTEVP